MKKLKRGNIALDSLWTMIGLVSMNGIAQFVVYPFLRNIYGADVYGRILSMLGIVNIVAVSIGTSLNNARLVAKSKGKGVNNKPYLLFLLLVLPVAFLLSLGVFVVMKEPVELLPLLLYWLLMCLTILKFYSEVEYRLNTNYVGLLFYYLAISAGYLLGILFVKITGQWTLGLLTGELFGFIFVLLRGSLYRKSQEDKEENLSYLWKSVRYLIVAQLLLNVVFNSDRIILMAFCDSLSVTIFYIASAVGKMISFVTSSFNSVIIGYLSKKKDALSTKQFWGIFSLVSLAVVLATGACYIGSIIYTKWLYPSDYASTKPFFLLANMAQIFYFSSGIFTTILLRYEKEKMQTTINVIYTIVFCAVTIPMTFWFGIWGYVYGILISNAFRYVLAAVICHNNLKRLERTSTNETVSVC